MIERLYYMTDAGEKTEFSVFSDFHVNVSKDVGGLSDVNNSLYSESTFGQDGETYVSGTIKAREIDITGHIKSTEKARQIELRRRLNHILNPKERGLLVYQCGENRRGIYCYVESAPVYKAGRFPQFSIQLRCPSPYWMDEEQTVARVAEWEGMMIFDNTDGLQLDDDWMIGNRTSNLIVEIQNEGDVPCGMTVIFTAEGAVSGPKLLNAETLEYIHINIDMVAGDVLTVCTEYGHKSAVLTRSGEQTNVFRYVDENTTFLQMEVGSNLFVAEAVSGLGNLSTGIQYGNLYLGA